MTQEDLQQIQTIVANARKVLILTHQNPSLDAMASLLAIKLAMEKMGKQVTAVVESGAGAEFASLSGASSVKHSIEGGNNLVLTYKPYALEDFEKVSYAEEEGPEPSFVLTIIPKEGVVLDPAKFHFSSSGGNVSCDLVFVIETTAPQSLGNLYNQSIFNNPTVNIINIDNHDENKDYGRFNLVEPQAATVSEITTFFLRAVNVPMDKEIANNLYKGLVDGSNNFQGSKITAATFEAAAMCLRSGVKEQQAEVPKVPPTANHSQNNHFHNQPKQDFGSPKVFRGTSNV